MLNPISNQSPIGRLRFNMHIYDKYKAQILKPLEDNFINACTDGYLNEVEHLLTSPNLQFNVNIHTQNDAGFLLACSNGHLDIVKYLLTSSDLKEHINIETNDNMGFLNSCWRNKLKVAKYLLTSPELKEHANIHAQKDRAFKIACEQGNLELAQFLIFDMNIQKTWYISRYLKQNTHEEINNYWNIRKLNDQLSKELKSNPSSEKKLKI
jgi:hypothetical protein